MDLYIRDFLCLEAVDIDEQFDYELACCLAEVEKLGEERV